MTMSFGNLADTLPSRAETKVEPTINLATNSFRNDLQYGLKAHHNKFYRSALASPPHQFHYQRRAYFQGRF
jgi:hypothetical protein